MFDVFRFAWFAVRTFFGVILLTLCAYVALWAFVKVLSAGPGKADPHSALRLVNTYNSRRIGPTDARPNSQPSSTHPSGREPRNP